MSQQEDTTTRTVDDQDDDAYIAQHFDGRKKFKLGGALVLGALIIVWIIA